MARRILIDLIKLRKAATEFRYRSLPDALFYPSININGLKTIRELATFRFTCRKCESAPCISVCPAEALEKDQEGLINRNTNLCISCKSCVTICPFGTMMSDFFVHHRNRSLLYDLNDPVEFEKFVKACPDGAVSITDSDERPEENIYKLNEKVLVKEKLYLPENK